MKLFSGKIEFKTTAKWFLFLCSMSITNISTAQSVQVKIDSESATFTEGKDLILRYQITQKSVGKTAVYSNYIHPLYGLDGTVLSENTPSDHPHHRGIFWAWHQLYIGDHRIGDGWERKDIHWDVVAVKELKKHKGAKTIQATIEWKSPLWLDSNGHEKAIIQEITTLKVFPKKDRYRQIDFTISLRALAPNIRLGGSEDEKGYGGFSPRIRLSKDITFTGSKGKIEPHNLPVKADGWLDVSGSIGKNGSVAGLTILCHPDNPGFPNPWILRSARSMQNAVYPHPGAIPVPLSETQPTVLRYSLLVHEGDAATIDIKQIYADYCKNK